MKQATETISERLDRFNGKPDHGDGCQCADCAKFNTPATTGVQAAKNLRWLISPNDPKHVVDEEGFTIADTSGEREARRIIHDHNNAITALEIAHENPDSPLARGLAPTTGVHTATSQQIKVRACSIVCDEHPEWGTWGVMEDRGDWFEILGRSGSRVLFKSEADKFWSVTK